jgi:hypothetical protein
MEKALADMDLDELDKEQARLMAKAHEMIADQGEKLIANDITIKVLTDVVDEIIILDNAYNEYSDGRPPAHMWRELVLKAREAKRAKGGAQ